MASSLYFEKFPLHPPPKPLESFSSYLLRLCEANGIEHLQALAGLVGLPAGSFSRLADYPPLSLGNLLARTTSSKKRLFATTLYFIGKNLGRSTLPSPIARFFANSLGTHLRYCPACLKEANYYSLLWRFLALPGCNRHGLRFLDRCGSCGKTIPLFVLPAQVGICPFCKGVLKNCLAEELPPPEKELAAQRTIDLKYLLASLDHENEQEHLRRLGASCAALRHTKGVLAQEVADQLGVQRKHIAAIEQGRKSGGAHFATYLRYADYLGVSLHALFIGSVSMPEKPAKRSSQPVPTNSTSKRQEKHQQQERELVRQVQAAIVYLQRHEELVTPSNIAKQLGRTRQGLQHYAAVKAIFDQFSCDVSEALKRRKAMQEQMLLQQVQEAVATLRACGQAPTLQAISEIADCSTGRLRYYPQVRAFLNQTMAPQYQERSQKRQLDEAILLKQVLAALETRQSTGEVTTQHKISALVGLSLHRLRQYPQIALVLEEVAKMGRNQRKKQAQLRERLLADQTQKAVELLRASGQPVTRQTVGKMVGLPPRALATYQTLRPLLAQISETAQPQRTQYQEQQLLEQVRLAIASLAESGCPITQNAISRLMGYTGPGLMYYPGFRELYRGICAERHQLHLRQAQQRERDLLKKVEGVIQQLKNQDKPFTLLDIGRQVGMSVSGLRYYLRVRAYLEQVFAQQRSHRQKRRQRNQY